MEEANIGFILGMVAGEGSFIIQLRTYDRGVGVSGSPVFQMALKDTDAEILHAMCETTGFGKVRYDSNGSHRSRAIWRIHGWDTCQAFAQDIESAANEAEMFRETDKYKTFVEWKNIIDGYGERKNDGIKSVEEAEELIHRAKSLNDDGNDGLSKDKWMDRIKR